MIRTVARAALVSLAVALIPSLGSAQGLHSVFTPDGLAVWAAGDSSAIYLSTDAGVSYQRLTAGPSPLPLYGIASSGFVALAVGAGGRVYRSTDFGGTWSTQDLAGAPDLRSLAIPVFGTAYAVGSSGTIRKSIDGGVTWSAQTSGVATTLRAVRFTDAQNGWAVGDGGTVLRTTNGGANWTPTLVPTSNDLLAIDQAGTEIWIGGVLGTCLKSSNGGANWSHVNLKLDVRSDVRAVRVVSASDVYVAGGGGFVRRTVNGGTNWTFQRHTMLARPSALAGFGPRLYLCSDRHRVVFRTADAGSLWGMPMLATFSRTFVQKLEIPFATTVRGSTIALNPQNPRTLFALLGAQAYKSLDEGETWSPVGIPVPGASRANAFVVSPKDTNLWVAAVAGLDGQIVRSTNAGASWSTQLTMAYGEYGIPLEMHPDRPDTLYFGPANAPLWRSTNFGSTWAEWTTDSAFRSPCDLIVVPDSSEIVLVGDGTTNSTNPPAQVYKSTNAGLTFQLMYSGPGGQDASEMPGMACSRLNKGVAIGTQWAGGGTVRSTNHGTTWTQVQPSPQAWGIDIARDDPNVIMFGQYSGQTFFLSTDAGSTWQGASTVSGSNYGLYARDRELILTTQSLVGTGAGPGIWKLKPTYSYTPVSAQYVNVNSPNGGESWLAGSVRSVVWSHQNIAIARIEYRKSAADPWQLVADVPGYHGGYDWTIPSDATYEAELRISDAWDGSPSDVCDIPFTILSPTFAAFPNPLNMGVVIPGLTFADTLHLENPGTATLSITSITSNHTEFSVSRTALAIPAGEADTITVFYHPLAAGPDTATLSVVATGLGTQQVTVIGRGSNNTNVPGQPSAFALFQNSPNPFGGRTMIRYALPVASDVTLEVFDLRGRRVATLVHGWQEAGEHSAPFGGTRDGAGAGVYFYRLKGWRRFPQRGRCFT